VLTIEFSRVFANLTKFNLNYQLTFPIWSSKKHNLALPTSTILQKPSPEKKLETSAAKHDRDK